MHKITLIMGIEKDKDNKLIPSQQQQMALRLIRLELAKRCGGYTEVATTGGWTNPQGRLVTELGYMFIGYLDNMSTAEAESIGFQLAQHAAAQLNQHSVVLEVQSMANVYMVEQGGYVHA